RAFCNRRAAIGRPRQDFASFARQPHASSETQEPSLMVFPCRKCAFGIITLALMLSLVSCSAKPEPNTLVMLIESSPTNLDPRVGVDAQSERIDNLIFDDLLSRGDNLDVAPG